MIKAVIIDDEERARRVLKNLIETYCEEVEVVAQCENVPEGVKQINALKPDVVFCDIEMPDYSGLELLQFFDKPDFEIIFATGYSEYALKAFEVSAVDYLLKPIQIEKLELAVEKLKSKLTQATMSSRLDTLKANFDSQQIQKVALPISEGLVFVDVKKIEILEADGAYTQVCLADGSTLLVSKKLKYFEQLLEGRSEFFRVHRSYIININGIAKYNRNEGYILMENDKNVRISRDKKSEFEAHISLIRL